MVESSHSTVSRRTGDRAPGSAEPREASSGRWPVAVGLVVALLGPPVVLNIPVATGTIGVGVLMDNLVMWLLAAGLLALVLGWERRGVESVGFRRVSGRMALLGLAAGVGITVVGLVATGAYAALSGAGRPPEGLGTLAALSWPHRIFLVVTAAVTEELLYRGYAIERLLELTGRLWLAVSLAGFVFLAVHMPFWGPAALPVQVSATVGLVGLYAWTRNLPVAMIAHATINALLLLVLPALA